jgi:hypothetical protein
MRLERAGSTREVFASGATVLLHEATIGALLDLERLAAAARRESARKKRKLVERDVVTQVIEAPKTRRGSRAQPQFCWRTCAHTHVRGIGL